MPKFMKQIGELHQNTDQTLRTTTNDEKTNKHHKRKTRATVISIPEPLAEQIRVARNFAKGLKNITAPSEMASEMAETIAIRT